jgi:hypothetical protein
MTIAKPSDWPDGEPEPDLDLGDGVWASFTFSGGEGITNTATGEPVPYAPRTGLITIHRCTTSETGWRNGHAGFDVPGNTDTRAATRWKVVSMDPLTLEPSLQHNCGCPLSHGFIRGGKWQRA